ncbi:DUF6087 family protein [Streptomyces sp. SAS_281]|uniref:DUF6087 family protein n=1 Tax=Streptomyces sp. SAS_281 TaxID=3412744 RepID=UPI00403CE2C6
MRPPASSSGTPSAWVPASACRAPGRLEGQVRAVPLGSGPRCGAHVAPGAPGAIEEWTGTEWVVVGVVENLAAAQALLYPPPPTREKPAE